MMLGPGPGEIRHEGHVEPVTPVAPGDTVLLPAELRGAALAAPDACRWLEITLPER